METRIRQAIVSLLNDNRELLRIPVRQRAKFEGWLKFELAHWLERSGMTGVEVESKVWHRRDRTDITFLDGEEPYSVELKTPNANWRVRGVSSTNRPITMNVQSIMDDAMKLNSPNGIVAFVLFPVPLSDGRWEEYLSRISRNTGLSLSRQANCELVHLDLDESNACSLVVCTFRSRRFRN